MAKQPTIMLDGKKHRLFKFQEELAQQYVQQLQSKGYTVINIPCGFGKRWILQRVVDLLGKYPTQQRVSAKPNEPK